MNKKRNPVIAFLFSLFPPVGQIYNGQLKKGIILYLIGISVPLLLLILKVPQTLPGLRITAVLWIAIYAFLIIDAVINAVKLKEYSLKHYNKWFCYILSILIVFIMSSGSKYIALNIIGTAKTFVIPSGSMKPTIMVGDWIIADISYYRSNKPERGDIVLYQPPHDPTKTYLHRCVALENDSVDFKDGFLYINGKKQIENYTKGGTFPSQANDKHSLKVPKDHIYILGDNRENAFDSRYSGFIPVKNLAGRPLYIYNSKDKKRIGIYFNK